LTIFSKFPIGDFCKYNQNKKYSKIEKNKYGINLNYILNIEFKIINIKLLSNIAQIQTEWGNLANVI